MADVGVRGRFIFSLPAKEARNWLPSSILIGPAVVVVLTGAFIFSPQTTQ
jgi:hypothetical protein